MCYYEPSVLDERAVSRHLRYEEGTGSPQLRVTLSSVGLVPLLLSEALMSLFFRLLFVALYSEHSDMSPWYWAGRELEKSILPPKSSSFLILRHESWIKLVLLMHSFLHHNSTQEVLLLLRQIDSLHHSTVPEYLWIQGRTQLWPNLK